MNRLSPQVLALLVQIVTRVIDGLRPRVYGSVPMPLITIKFKKQILKIEISFERTVNDLFEYLSEVVEIEKLHVRLIAGGKSYSAPSFEEQDTQESPKLKNLFNPKLIPVGLLISSSVQEVEKVKKLRADPLVKGFAEEQRDEISRIKRTKFLEAENPWGFPSKQDSEFRFSRIEVLFKRLTPAPFEAEKLLKKLTMDPGILEIMRQKRFIVGTLCELDPLDADIEQAEKGEGDKCLLGWNRNFGERIALRLRTDDFKSFRKYESVANTLIHELSHNIFGPHNDQFWTLYNELKEIYRNVHASRLSGKSVSNISKAPSTIEVHQKLAASANSAAGSRLGGNTNTTDTEAMRSARLRALEK